jgi:hypothetical protein
LATENNVFAKSLFELVNEKNLCEYYDSNRLLEGTLLNVCRFLFLYLKFNLYFVIIITFYYILLIFLK